MRITDVPSRFPIGFTLGALLITALVGILLAGVVGVQWLHMSISAVAAIALAILLRRHIGNVFILPKPRDALLYGTPLLVYPMLTPLMTGGYNFALLSPQLVIYMASVGIYEEVLIHGIAMNLLVDRYVHARREPALLRAAMVSSLTSRPALRPDCPEAKPIMAFVNLADRRDGQLRLPPNNCKRRG